MKKDASDASTAHDDERPEDADDLRPEYDPELIRRGVRGRYAARYAEGTNVVVLDPDIAAAFPTREAVNAALRALLSARPPAA